MSAMKRVEANNAFQPAATLTARLGRTRPLFKRALGPYCRLPNRLRTDRYSRNKYPSGSPLRAGL